MEQKMNTRMYENRDMYLSAAPLLLVTLAALLFSTEEWTLYIPVFIITALVVACLISGSEASSKAVIVSITAVTTFNAISSVASNEPINMLQIGVLAAAILSSEYFVYSRYAFNVTATTAVMLTLGFQVGLIWFLMSTFLYYEKGSDSEMRRNKQIVFGTLIMLVIVALATILQTPEMTLLPGENYMNEEPVESL